jgi:hypothetical protein
LSSLDDLFVLAGGNTCAIRNADGQWEILQFATAELIAADQYKLTRLLRGQLGSEYAMRSPVAAGAPFVVLDTTVMQSSIVVTEGSGDRRPRRLMTRPTRSPRSRSMEWACGPTARCSSPGSVT